jgi:hypothetical protein
MVWSARLTVYSRVTPCGTCSVQPHFGFPSAITEASVGARPLKLRIWHLPTLLPPFPMAGRQLRREFRRKRRLN